MSKTASTGDINRPFLTDVQTLRDRARSHLETGNVTQSHKGDVTQAITILQSVLATEIVWVLRYTRHAVAAAGISSEGVKAEFAQHAKEEQTHMMAVAGKGLQGLRCGHLQLDRGKNLEFTLSGVCRTGSSPPVQDVLMATQPQTQPNVSVHVRPT